MDWSAVGAIGEVIGGVGVIVTLIYLSIQIRLNTKATNKQSLRDATELLMSCYRSVTDDEALAEIFVKGMEDYESLIVTEKERFHYLNTTQLHAATTIIGLTDQDDGSVPSMLDYFDRRMSSPGYRTWWNERGRNVVAKDYLELIDEYHAKHEQEST